MLRSSATPTLRKAAASLQAKLGAAPASSRGFLTIVHQGKIAYRLTLGRNPVKLTPGLSLYIPFLHSIHHIDMRERAVNIDSLGCYTSENVPTTVSGSLFYRVIDGEKALFAVQDYERSTAAIGTSALRSTVGGFTYDSLISNRGLLNDKLQTTIGNSVAEWGIECSKFEVQNFHPSNREVEKQLEQQMEAERNRRRQLLDTEALVNVAEGKKKRDILNSEAELQSRINEAEGQFASTAKEGEALAAQITVIARSLVGDEGGQPTAEQLSKAAELIVELRRQEMLKAVAEGKGNHTYFLHENLGPMKGAEFETDASERWKRSLQERPRMTEGGY